jgi:hypothetical protein
LQARPGLPASGPRPPRVAGSRPGTADSDLARRPPGALSRPTRSHSGPVPKIQAWQSSGVSRASPTRIWLSSDTTGGKRHGDTNRDVPTVATTACLAHRDSTIPRSFTVARHCFLPSFGHAATPDPINTSLQQRFLPHSPSTFLLSSQRHLLQLFRPKILRKYS